MLAGSLVLLGGGCEHIDRALLGCEVRAHEHCPYDAEEPCVACEPLGPDAARVDPVEVFMVTGAASVERVEHIVDADAWGALQEELEDESLPSVAFDEGHSVVVVREHVIDSPCSLYGWVDGVWASGSRLYVRTGFHRLISDGCTEAYRNDATLAIGIVVPTRPDSLQVCNIDADWGIVVHSGPMPEIEPYACVGHGPYNYENGMTVPPPPTPGGGYLVPWLTSDLPTGRSDGR